jgi:RimJ/RimL family protein N-acetyltransferase
MDFDLQPTLKGELLAVRPLAATDFDALYAVASDPLIWAVHPARDRYQREVFERFFAEGLASGGALLVTELASGAVIGSSRYSGYDVAASEIEIGWTFLARRCWGGACNGELKRLMLAHAFRFVDNVVFLVGPENWRSQRAMEKVGGVRVANRIDRKGAERLVYRITAAEFGRKSKRPPAIIGGWIVPC